MSQRRNTIVSFSLPVREEKQCNLYRYFRISSTFFSFFQSLQTVVLCLHDELPTKAKRSKPTSFRYFSCVFVRYSIETREKTQSSGFQIKLQDGVREAKFSSDFGDFEREEKVFSEDSLWLIIIIIIIIIMVY